MNRFDEPLRLSPTDPERIREVQVTRYDRGVFTETDDEVAAEEPFEVRIAGRSVAVIMRTPGQDRYLGVGFLVGEGILTARGDLVSIEPGLDRDGFPQPNVLDLRLRPELESAERSRARGFSVSSSCGLCGSVSIDAARVHARPIPPGGRLSAPLLLGLEERLRAAQEVFARTGGLHAAGLFDPRGVVIAHHEDVGRHNAVDKVVGQLFLEDRLPAGESILVVSGRASFELVQKAAIAGIPILAAVGAPSSLAVEMAEASGLTLIGYLRPARFVVYCGVDRVAG